MFSEIATVIFSQQVTEGQEDWRWRDWFGSARHGEGKTGPRLSAGIR
jgi:hypothetical protein